MQILIDFDGTCTTHAFPYVGKDIGAASVLKELTEAGNDLILFTMRSTLPYTLIDENGNKTKINTYDWFKNLKKIVAQIKKVPILI